MDISEYIDLIFSNPPKELKHSLIKHINEDMQHYSTVFKLLSEEAEEGFLNNYKLDKNDTIREKMIKIWKYAGYERRNEVKLEEKKFLNLTLSIGFLMIEKYKTVRNEQNEKFIYYSMLQTETTIKYYQDQILENNELEYEINIKLFILLSTLFYMRQEIESDNHLISKNRLFRSAICLEIVLTTLKDANKKTKQYLLETSLQDILDAIYTEWEKRKIDEIILINILDERITKIIEEDLKIVDFFRTLKRLSIFIRNETYGDFSLSEKRREKIAFIIIKIIKILNKLLENQGRVLSADSSINRCHQIYELFEDEINRITERNENYLNSITVFLNQTQITMDFQMAGKSHINMIL